MNSRLALRITLLTGALPIAASSCAVPVWVPDGVEPFAVLTLTFES